MSKPLVPVVGILIVMVGSSLAAQTGSVRRAPSQRPAVTFAESWRPANVAGDTRIIGTVVDIGQTPVAGVTVRLRNLLTGQVAEETQSSETGEYAFQVENPGTYVVEMVMLDGSILALSNAGSLARYETLQTVVMLPGRWNRAINNIVVPQNPGTFLGMSAQATMAASTVVMAMSQNVRPVDAGEPVSPIRP